MKKFIVKESRVLDDYESYHTFTLHCYGMGAVIHSKQDQVVKSNSEIKNHTSLVVTGLTNDEAIELRDYLINRYPVERDNLHKPLPPSLINRPKPPGKE